MRFRRAGCFLAWGGVLVLLLSHLVVANFRTPYPAAAGQSIHAPKQWKDSRVEKIRVSTYNIHRATGLDGVTDIDRIAALLSEDDIVGIQEARGHSFLNEKDQVALLAEKLNTGWLFAPIQKRYYQSYIGNGLLSRFPVNDWQRQPLIWADEFSSNRSRRYRNMLFADLVLNDQPVRIFVTHLDTGAIRPTQLQFVLSEFQQHKYAILLADLNTRDSDPLLGQWLAKYPGSDAIGTVLGPNDTDHRIDWILVKGFQPSSGGMSPPGLSDHPYYWVELEMRMPNS